MQYIDEFTRWKILEFRTDVSFIDALERVYGDVFIGHAKGKRTTEYRLLMTAYFNTSNLYSAKGPIVDRVMAEKYLMCEYKDELEAILDDYRCVDDGGYKTENSVVYILPFTR